MGEDRSDEASCRLRRVSTPPPPPPLHFTPSSTNPSIPTRRLVGTHSRDVRSNYLLTPSAAVGGTNTVIETQCQRTKLQYATNTVNRQWRSKALRGPGSTVTWGPSLPSPPLPLPPSPFLLFPSPAPPPAAKRPPNPARGSGERCKLPQRGLGGATAEIEFGAF